MFRGRWFSSSSSRRLLPRRSIMRRFGSDSFGFDVLAFGFVHRFTLLLVAQHRANRRPSRKITRSRNDSNDEEVVVLVAGGGSIACRIRWSSIASTLEGRRTAAKTEVGRPMRKMMPTTWWWSWVKLQRMMGPEREMMVPHAAPEQSSYARA